MKRHRGKATPLGPSIVHHKLGADGSDALTVNIAIYAIVPKITICIFPPVGASQLVIRDMIEEFEVTAKTGDVWHITLEGVPYDASYAIRIPDGASNRLLCDPYAKWVESAGADMWMKIEGEQETSNRKDDKVQIVKNHIQSFPTLKKMGIEYPFRLSRISCPGSSLHFDWGKDRPPQVSYDKMVIYEAHVKGMSSKGTFSDAIRVIPYLKWLGITALQLMPIFEFNEMEIRSMDSDYFLLRKKGGRNLIRSERRGNMWGYNPLSLFSPMNRYASNMVNGGALELKKLVRALHLEGIECILDVVFNHSANGSCPLHFFNVQHDYFIGKSGPGTFKHINISGCGNTLSPNSPLMLDMIMQSLRWFITEYRVDGFRLDAAGILCRDKDGNPMESPSVIDHIRSDPVLKGIKFIVEGWDAGDQIGSPNMLLGSKNGFPSGERFCEWNAHWRDSVRTFFRGDKDSTQRFCHAIKGYPDFFRDRKHVQEYHPKGSHHGINFVACHDGFSMADVVSYSKRTNSDGYDEISFNCGKNGNTRNPKIIAERAKQVRNFIFSLAVSRGVPMIHQGDELGFSKNGNSNTWNDPSLFSASLPDHPEECQALEGIVKFTREVFSLRKNFSQLQGSDFHDSIRWLDSSGKLLPGNDTKEYESQGMVAFTTDADERGRRLYIAFNNSKESVDAKLPKDVDKRIIWFAYVDTSNSEVQEKILTEKKSQSIVKIRQKTSVLYIGREG